jgi:hypothetical protein
MTDGPDGSGYLRHQSIGHHPARPPVKARTGGILPILGAARCREMAAGTGLRARFLGRWRTIRKAPEGSLTATENVTVSIRLAMPKDRMRGRIVLIASDCFPRATAC